MNEKHKQKDVRQCLTLGYDESIRDWILDPFVRLTDVYNNKGLCQRYNVRPPLLRVVLYQCRGCPGKVYRSSENFVDHCRKVHSYKCELCCSIVDNQTSLDQHLESRHFNKTGMCRKCDIVIPEPGEFRRHLLKHGIIGSPDMKPRRMDEMPIIEYMGSLEAPELIVISDTEDEAEIPAKSPDKEMGTKTIKSSELKSVWNDLRVKSSCRCRTCQTFFPSILEAYRHLKDQHATHLRKDDTILGQVKMKVKIIKVSRTEEEKDFQIPEPEKPKPKAITTPLIRVRTNLFAEPPQEKPDRLPHTKPAPGKVIKASEVLQLNPTGSTAVTATKDFILQPIKSELPPLMTIPEPPDHFTAILQHSPPFPPRPVFHLLPPPPELQPFPSSSAATTTTTTTSTTTELLPTPVQPVQSSNLKIVNVSSAGTSTILPKHTQVISLDDEDAAGHKNGGQPSLPLPKATPPPRRLKLTNNTQTNGVKRVKLANESMYQVFDM